MSQLELFERDDKGVAGAVWWAGHWQCRNNNGFFQDREDGKGPWKFVIYGFGETDCTVYRVSEDGQLSHCRVPIDERNRILINGRRHGPENWRH
ncbi:hypothetical protein [Roseibium aggregatum]|jgi:hypothetical protein|uniref:Uncharacterized protein n=1 Tax=Roseibium aggregatum TaxID=187304 RepID=A0A0M6YEJ1_9HYPH|nr:hypothetical protein [Roseibium aggregatum]MCR9284796.1 hypothetical protein [Paracoccaceae bacterium]CTQ47677.1 hypothetical protein LAL4801_06139 [Roseibium aggregatum]